MSRWGFKFAMVEHRWERRTNYVLLIGIVVVLYMFYFNVKYIPYIPFNVTSTMVALGFLILAGIVHLIARLGHKGEQFFFKKNRPWRR